MAPPAQTECVAGAVEASSTEEEKYGTVSNQAAAQQQLYDALSGAPVPGGLSQRLWEDAHAHVQDCLHHPFVTGLATGALPKHAFQHYILQDAFFLSVFSRAYAAALDKLDASMSSRPRDASTRDMAAPACHQQQQCEMARPVLQCLLLSVHEELRLHSAYAARWGVDVRGPLLPSAATAAYCSFLLEVAHDPQSSVAEVLAAMIPCSRLYGFLGCRLAAATSHLGRHAYSEWVDTYSSEAYLEGPVAKERLFDALIHDVSYDRLRELYLRAMQLEVNFFSAQPGTPPPRNIGLLVADFDETCTERDTISVLLGAAVEAATATAAAASRADASDAVAAASAARAQAAALVQQLAENYVAKQKQLLGSLLPPIAAAPGSSDAAAAAAAAAGAVAPPPSQHDCQALLALCEALSDFDTAMNQVVVDAGVLKGLTAVDITTAVQAGVQLRPGCAATLAAAAAAGIPTALLSVNWSTTLIRAALDSQQQRQQQQPDVHANELEFDARGVSTGQLQRRVENGRDKLRLLQQLVQQHRQAASSSSASAAAAAGHDNGSSDAGTSAVVYVGDSASDILPLLEADYGIIIGHNKLLRRVLAAHSVTLRPLCAAPLQHADSSSNSSSSSSSTASPGAPGHVLYEASSWHEIAAFLFGPRPSSEGSSSIGSSRSQQGFASLVHVTSDRAAALQALPADAAAIDRLAAAVGGAAGGAAAAADSPPLVLTIAGSDSGGGAGIQADLKTIMVNGGFGMSALTALTAQNSTGVQGVHVPPPQFLEQQLDSVLSDLPPAAIKTGMLPDAAAVAAVAHTLQRRYVAAGRPLPPLVVDPVMISTSGHALAEGGVGAALRQHLLPLAAVVTPNLQEAEVLWGAGRRITSLQDMEDAAVALHNLGCRLVLIKGGHLAERQQQHAAAGNGSSNGSQQQPPQQIVDVLFDGTSFTYFSGPCVATPNSHGTGCTLAAAIATSLARGASPVEAVAAAKGYLTFVLAAGRDLCLGAGPQHPFHHGAGFAGSAAAAAASLLAPPLPLAAAAAATTAPTDTQQQLAPHVLNPVDLRLYVVTDPGCNARAGRSLLQAVAAAVEGGATIVQLREKDIDGGDFLREATDVVRFCRPRNIPVVINDRVDVALAAGADGVHVGQSDLPAAAVRRLLGPHCILGVSVKTPAEAAKAQADGADYIGVGAVYPTGTKDASVIGLDGLAAVCAMSGLPAVAIGGVGAANAAQVVAAGVAGLAVVSAVFAAPDAAAAARELRVAVDAALAQQQEQGGAPLQAAAVGSG